METDSSFSHRTIGNRINRRGFLRLAGAASAGLLLNACGSMSSGPGSEQDRVQIVYQDWSTEWFPPMAQEMLEQFHQEHPEILVFFVPDPADVEVTLADDMQAGTAADVFAACCSFFPILAQEGYTLDLRPLVASDLDPQIVEDWDPAQYQALSTRDGQQYGLPKYHGALALYYNKDLFDQYQVDYPDDSWDHDDYLEAMKRLTDDRDGDGQIDLWGSILDVSWDRIQIHVNAWGGHFSDPQDPTRCLMGEPPALEAMEWIRARMWQDRVMATPLDVKGVPTYQAFTNQQVAMVEDGSWALKSILEASSFRLGVAPMPKGPVRRATLATTDGFGIYNRTRYPQESWELLKFLISREYGLAMARTNFLQPARASLVEDWVNFVRQEYPQKTQGMDIATFADGHMQGYSVTAEVFANMEEAKRITYDAWDRIFTLGQEPVSLMKEAAAQIQAAQKDI
jgi:multiple sugar transport system substrate-binding protein